MTAPGQAGRRADGWTSMQDREPDLHDYVRIRKASGSEGFGVFVGHGWMIQAELIPEKFEGDATGVTHWMPLPESPVANVQEEDS